MTRSILRVPLALLALAACADAPLDLTVAATPAEITLGDTTSLAAVSKSEGPLAFAWTIVSAPAGSAALPANPAEATTPFSPDISGTYVLEVKLADATLRTGGGLASALGTRGPVTAQVTVEVKKRPPATLSFRVQPTDIVAGALFDPDVEVVVLDSVGTVVEASTAEIVLELKPTARRTLGLIGTKRLNAVAGVAKFPGLTVQQVGVDLGLLASSTGLPTAESEAFDVKLGPIDLAHSSFTVSPSTAVAGVQTPALDLALRDAFDNPAPDVQVAFSSTVAADELLPAQGATDGDGQFSGTIGSPKVGARTVTAAFAGGPLTANVTFVAGVPDPDRSSITMSPETLVADGVAKSTATVVVRDAFDNPIGGATVTLTASGSGHTFDPAQGTSGADGVFTATITSTVAETKKVTAAVTGWTIGANVVFTPGPPDAARVTLVASPTTVLANGTDLSTITIRIADALDNPIEDAAPAFSVSGTSNTVTPVVAGATTTDAFGVLAYTLKSTKAEAKNAHLVLGAITKDAPITFVAGQPDTATSTITATPDNVLANGTAITTVTVTLKDSTGNPVPDVDVVGSSNGTGNTVTPATAQRTGANGRITFTVRSTKAELKRLTATFGPASIFTNITFVPGAPNAAHSLFTATPASLVADGVATSALKATVRDLFDNPISGVTVTFTATGTLNTLSAPTGVTDAAGVAQVTLASTKAESKTAKASFATPVIDLTATVAFVPGAAAKLVFVQQPSNVVAAVAMSPAVTVAVQDATGNVVPTSTAPIGLALGATPTGGNISGNTGTSAVSGVGTWAALKVDKAQSGYTLVATSTGLAPATSTTFNVTAGPPDAALTTFAAAPTTVVANDVSTSTLTATVKDAGGNLLPGVTVTLTSSGTGHTFAPATPQVTTATGVLTATVRSNLDQVKTISALVTLGATSFTKTATVTFTEAPPEIISMTPPATMGSCASITYRIRQLQSKPVTVRFEYDTTGAGLYLTATRHTTLPDGLTALTSSPAGTNHTFVWNTTADVAHRTFTTVRIKGTPTLSGVDGVAQTVTAQTVDNALKFANPASGSASNGAFGLASGDMNLDGYPDLVTNGTLSVTVLLNNRAGAFATAGNFASSNPSGIAIGDVNGDGRPDVILANENPLQFQGDGAGGLVSRPMPTTGEGMVGVSLADVERDGDLDVIGSTRSGKFLVYRNDGAGTFALGATVSTTGTQFWASAAGDLNRDGRIDLVGVGDNSTAYVALGNGDGTFGAAVGYPSGRALGVSIADLNRDGAPDLVTGNGYGTQSISILLNTGAGAFAAPVSYSSTIAARSTVADVDDDGLLDVVVSGFGGGYSFHKGKGDGTVEVPRRDFGVAASGGGVAVDDFNQDGRLDIAVVDGAAGNSGPRTSLNTQSYRCDPGFRAATATAAQGTAASPFLAQADFDRDGRLDVVTAKTGTFGVSFGQPNGTFAAAVSFPVRVGSVDYPVTALDAGDVNRDGYPDLVFTSTTATAGLSNLAVVVLNTKNRTFAAATNVAASSGTAYPQSVTLADLTRDGILDLVVPRPNGATGVLPGSSAGSFGAAVASGGAGANPFGSPLAAAVFDYNRDGRPDVALGGNVGHVMSGNGTGALTSVFSGPDIQTFITPGAGDYNHDGWPDAALASDNGGSPGSAVRLFLNNKAGSFTIVNHGSVAGGAATGLAQADVDGDGNQDFLLPATSGNLGVHYVKADATAFPGQAYAIGATTVGRAVSGDYNFDGIPDAVVVDTSGSIRVLMGR